MSDIFDLCLGSAAAGLTRVDLATLANEWCPMRTVTLSDGVAREAMNVGYSLSHFSVPDHAFKAGEKYEVYVITGKGCAKQIYSQPNAPIETIRSEYLPDELEVGKWVYTPTEDFVIAFYFTNDGDHSECDYFGLAYVFTPVTVNDKLTTIADNIRAKTGGTEKLSLDDMAESIDEVYDLGVKSEYDRFWDDFQDNGKRMNYNSRFFAWKNRWYTPKYPIRSWIGTSIFQGSEIVDTLVDIEISNPVVVSMQNTFHECRNLVTIRKLIIPAAITKFNNAFYNCIGLQNLTIEGVINGNGLDLQWSTLLSHDSIVSIVNALSETASGLSITLSSVAVNNAFETSAGAADGSTSAEWLALVGTKSNWTISLI